MVRLGAVIGCVALIGSQTAARASDDIGDFFAKAFGFANHQPSYDQPAMDQPPVSDRPLIVRPSHRRPRIAKATTDVPKGPIGPVSIYEDRTLRRGDAVMTANGIRIFKGAESLPYRDADFVAVSDADGLAKPVSKALLAIDRVPRT